MEEEWLFRGIAYVRQEPSKCRCVGLDHRDVQTCQLFLNVSALTEIVLYGGAYFITTDFACTDIILGTIPSTGSGRYNSDMFNLGVGKGSHLFW